MKEHWYFTTIYYCVLCGRTKEYKTRMYGIRPEDPRERYEEIEEACADHFM